MKAKNVFVNIRVDNIMSRMCLSNNWSYKVVKPEVEFIIY